MTQSRYGGSGLVVHASPEVMGRSISALHLLREEILAIQGASRQKVQSGLRVLEAREDEADDKIRSLIDSIEDLDSEDDDYEDDFDELTSDLEDVKSHRGNLENSQREGREILERVERAEILLEEITTTRIPEAISFIRSKLALLTEFQEYHLGRMVDDVQRSQPDPSRNSLPRSGEGDCSSNSSLGVSPPSGTSLLSIKLPRDLEWIPISQILDAQGLVPEDLHFKKASPDEFKDLLLRFQSEILPELRRCKNLESLREALVQKDLESGRFMADSLANTYDIFFGEGAIAAERGAVELTNGRHRAWIAVQLGWSHLPGKRI
jgi:hypothetical protein